MVDPSVRYLDDINNCELQVRGNNLSHVVVVVQSMRSCVAYDILRLALCIITKYHPIESQVLQYICLIIRKKKGFDENGVATFNQVDMQEEYRSRSPNPS
jgi:hypothetical protein